MRSKLVVVLFAALAVTSCKSVVNSVKDAKTLESDGAMFQTATLVDLNVSPARETYEISYESGGDVLFPGLEQAKKNAVAELLQKTNSDVLVEPRYSIQSSSSNVAGLSAGAAVTVKVSGYPAKYKNFKALEAADSTVIMLNKYIHSNEVQYPKKGSSVVKNVVVN